MNCHDPTGTRIATTVNIGVQVFEYKIDFLMGPNNTIDNAGSGMHYCYASGATDDHLAELARLVGSGSTLSRPRQVSKIELVDNAPALEFDLENELSQAFGSQESETVAVFDSAVDQATPVNSPIQKIIPDISARQPLLSTPSQPDTLPLDDHKDDLAIMSASDEDLSDILAEELDRALAEEMAEEPISVTTVQSELQTAETVPDPALSQYAESNLQFEKRTCPIDGNNRYSNINPTRDRPSGSRTGNSGGAETLTADNWFN